MNYTDIERLINESKDMSISFDNFTNEYSWRRDVGKKEKKTFSEDNFDEEYNDYLHDSTEELEEVIEEEEVIKTFLNKHPFKLISSNTGTPCGHCGYGDKKEIIIEYELNGTKERCSVYYFSGCLTYNPEFYICDVIN